MKPTDLSRTNRDHRDEGREGEHPLATPEAELAGAIELANSDNLSEADAELSAALLEEIAELRAILAPFTVRVLPPVGPRRGD